MLNSILPPLAGIAAGAFVYSSTTQGDIFSGSILLSVTAFISVAILFTAIRFVPQKHEMVTNFLGTKFHKTFKAGIHITLPWPLVMVEHMTDLRVQTPDPEKVEVKTSDNMVFHLPFIMNWRVLDAEKFVYSSEDPRARMMAVVQENLVSTVEKRSMEEVYSKRIDIKQDVIGKTRESLENMGLEIVELGIQDPQLDTETKAKMNSVRNAQFSLEAAQFEAQAKIVEMRGKGQAAAAFRLSAAEGNAAAMAVMQGKAAVTWKEAKDEDGRNVISYKIINPADAEEGDFVIPTVDMKYDDILQFLSVMDGNDAIRDAAASGALALGGGHGGSVAIPTGSAES